MVRFRKENILPSSKCHAGGRREIYLHCCGSVKAHNRRYADGKRHSPFQEVSEKML